MPMKIHFLQTLTLLMYCCAALCVAQLDLQRHIWDSATSQGQHDDAEAEKSGKALLNVLSVQVIPSVVEAHDRSGTLRWRFVSGTFQGTATLANKRVCTVRECYDVPKTQVLPPSPPLIELTCGVPVQELWRVRRVRCLVQSCWGTAMGPPGVHANL